MEVMIVSKLEAPIATLKLNFCVVFCCKIKAYTNFITSIFYTFEMGFTHFHEKAASYSEKKSTMTKDNVHGE